MRFVLLVWLRQDGVFILKWLPGSRSNPVTGDACGVVNGLLEEDCRFDDNTLSGDGFGSLMYKTLPHVRVDIEKNLRNNHGEIWLLKSQPVNLNPGGHLNLKMPSYQYMDPQDPESLSWESHAWKDGLYVEKGPRFTDPGLRWFCSIGYPWRNNNFNVISTQCKWDYRLAQYRFIAHRCEK